MTTWVEMEHVDALPVRGTTYDDLDERAIRRHLDRARDVSGLSTEEYLRKRRGVVELEAGLVPTLGGLLCFGKQPQQFLPFTGFSLTRYSSLTPNSKSIVDIRDVEGTLFDCIEAAVLYVRERGDEAYVIRDGLRREPVPQFSPIAVRELVVNAAAHRDYRVAGSSVRIEMFRNAIEFSSPGGLPPGVTVLNILRAQYTRNPIIVNFLYDSRLIERRGMGLPTVFDAQRAEGLDEPEMEDTGASFHIRINGHRATNRYAALGLDGELAVVYELVERAGRVGTTTATIAPQLGKSERSTLRYLEELRTRGLISRSGEKSARRYHIADSSGI
jgi:predicted HTH transcriptional regulator